MSKRPRIPRRKQVPGTFRSHEKKGPDPDAEPQRIVLYLPISALDRAEEQSIRAGVDTVQRYCEALLLRAITAEATTEQHQDEQSRRGRINSLLAIAEDPDYLADWSSSLLDRPRLGSDPEEELTQEDALGVDSNTDSQETLVERPAEEVVFRHSGLTEEDPSAFLTSLRRGGPVSPDAGRELMQAIVNMEAIHRGETSINRRLAYALHKLAFEGQILASEVGSGASVDESTIDLLRLIQEGVDRILSGQDIRYYSSHDPSSNI